MLKRLRRKFILVVMGSLTAVLAVFVLVLNCVNYTASAAAADQLLLSISENQGEVPQYSGDPPGQMPGTTPSRRKPPTRPDISWCAPTGTSL